MGGLDSIKAWWLVYPTLISLIVVIFGSQYLLLPTLLGPNNEPLEIQHHLNVEEELTENSVRRITIQEGIIVRVSATLVWDDEPSLSRLTNRPDFFQLTLVSPTNQTVTETPMTPNNEGEQGYLELKYEANSRIESGRWTIRVISGDAGDHEGVGAIRTIPDDGNSFSLIINYNVIDLDRGPGNKSEATGAIYAISGLINVLLGIFLLTKSVMGHSVEELLDDIKFPVFIASLIFIFNGLGLFNDAATYFVYDPVGTYWKIVSNVYFFSFTFPLILIFAFYFPRPLFKGLSQREWKLGFLIFAILLSISIVVAHYVFVEDHPYVGIVYRACIIPAIAIFVLRYMFAWSPESGNKSVRVSDSDDRPGYVLKGSLLRAPDEESAEDERNWFGFIIVGFIFGPMFRIGTHSIWNESNTVAIIMTLLESGPAIILALILISYLILSMSKRKGNAKYPKFEDNKREYLFLMVLISTVLLALVWLPFNLPFVPDPYEIGFAVIRPICFTIAILSAGLFKDTIEIRFKTLIYSIIVVGVSVVFSVSALFFQQFMNDYLLMSILVVSSSFIFISPGAVWIAQRCARKFSRLIPHLSGRANLDDVEDQSVESFREIWDDTWNLKSLIAMFLIGMFIGLAEIALSMIINYPTYLSYIIVAILFPALGYSVEGHFQTLNGKAQAVEC